MLNSKAIHVLATNYELKEIEAVFGKRIESKAISVRNKAIPKGVVKLKRTFNMEMDGMKLRFWRVIAPVGHPNLDSDLSLAGLKDWGII